MHAYVHGFIRVSMMLLDTFRGVVAEIFNLCIGVHIHAYVYVCACMRVYVHVYTYVYVYMYVCVYVCKCMYIHTRVGVQMHSCRCILFICIAQSLYYMHVYHKCFLTPVRVCGMRLEVRLFAACSWFSLFMVCTCCWRERLCFGKGGDRGFVWYISVIFAGVRVVGGCVLVYVRSDTQTSWLLNVSPGVAQTPGWKNPDELKRSIHASI